MAAAAAAWTEDTLAGLAEVGRTLADGTQLLVGHVTFAAAGPAFTPFRRTPVTPLTLLRWSTSTPTSWQVPRPGCQYPPPDSGPAFELRIETWSQGLAPDALVGPVPAHEALVSG